MQSPWRNNILNNLQIAGNSIEFVRSLINFAEGIDMKRVMGVALLCIGACSMGYAADNTSQQIQLLNSQIQAQLQKIQADEKKQIDANNASIQAQLKKLQTDLQAQLVANNAKSQDQLKQMQTTLQQQIVQMQTALQKEITQSQAKPAK